MVFLLTVDNTSDAGNLINIFLLFAPENRSRVYIYITIRMYTALNERNDRRSGILYIMCMCACVYRRKFAVYRRARVPDKLKYLADSARFVFAHRTVGILMRFG